jgi:hypothetical protein
LSARHCAHVGAREAVEAANQLNARYWREAKPSAAEQAEIAANGDFTEPEWHEYVSPDACEKYHGRSWVTRFRSAADVLPTSNPDLTIPEDLSIPTFLRREVRG